VALSRDIVIRLLGDADSALKAQKAAADAAGVNVAAYRKAERAYAQMQAAQERASAAQREAMDKVGKGAALMGAAVIAGLGLATKAAIDWESAWAGVSKVVSGTPKQMNDLEDSLRGLARTLPATHEEIAGVAAAAGQLGISRQNIVEFTKTAIALGVSTNLSAEDAATGLARLSNIMGTSSADVDRLGSTLVALGNAGASTESEILDMGLRIAAAGRQAGMSEGDVLGLANAMSSLGIEAEAGGTAISTVIKTINSSVISGGSSLKEFAKLAGTTSEAFQAAWKKDAASALVSVVEGLSKMQKSGQDVNAELGLLGFNNIRVSDTMLRLAGNADGLSGSLATGNKAWADNNALMNEANKRYETTASRLQIARNQITDAAIDIGGTFLPILAKGAEIIADFARGFQELPGPLKDIVGFLGLGAGAIALIGGAAIVAAPKIIAFRAAMATLSESSSAAVSGLGKFGTFMTGPWGAAIFGVVTGLGLLVTALGASSRASEEAASYQRDLASALRESKGVIDENVRALAARQAEDAKVGNSSLLQWADKLGVSLPRVTDALLGNRDAYKEITSAIDVQIAALKERASHLTQGGGQEAAAIQAQIDQYGELKNTFKDLSNSMGGAVAENQRLAEAQDASTVSGANMVDGVQVVSGAMAALGDTTGQTTSEIEDWIKQLAQIGAAFAPPLETYKDLLAQKQQAEQEAASATAAATEDSSDSWKDYVQDVSVSLDEYAAKLEEQITNQQNWRTNLGIVAQRAGVEVAQILADMGAQGVDLVAQMANGSDAEMQRMAADLVANAQLGGEGAAAALDTQMRVMAAIGASGAQATALGIAQQLDIGADQVMAIAQQYGINLASGIDPLLIALGKTPVMRGTGGGRAIGQAVYNADGGVYENHQAEIAPGGAMRVWAEPETGGEAYIPLHPSKRARSVGIWQQTGRHLGMFADGGFYSPGDVPKPYSTAPYGPPLSSGGDAAMSSEYDAVINWLKTTVMAGAAPSGGAGGAARWSALVLQALAMMGQPASLLQTVLRRMNQESGGNPNAINLWDSNAKRGTPSIGLMQTIEPTFRAYHDPRTSWNIRDPLANVLASMHYALARYGSLSAAYNRKGGYATGTDYVPETGDYQLHKSEAVLNPREAAAYRAGQAVGAGIPVGSRTAGLPAAAPMPTHFTGDLYLDSGEFVGKVRGVARAEATAAVNDFGERQYRQKVYK
jgi:TP901 family phage tail tape measure protein